MSEEPGSGRPAWPHGASPESHVVLDARGLRALAHPVRVQLVGLLRKHGPSTATRLAERMGLTSGATSYHLRQLAAAGFVAEDPERGNARERWWRSVHRVTWWTDTDLADQEPEAALAFWQSVLAANSLNAQRVLGSYHTMPREWRHRVDFSDWLLRLTPEEARQLTEELVAVVSRYRRDDPEALADAPEDSARVALVLQLLPDPESTGTDPDGPAVPEDRDARDDRSGTDGTDDHDSTDGTDGTDEGRDRT